MALAVPAPLWPKPMHPYEIAQTLRRQGKDSSTKINYGSLHTVVQNLQKHGFVEVTDVERQGDRPERTVYGITEAGRQETAEWMPDLVAFPAKEYPIFETALSLLGVLHPGGVGPRLPRRDQEGRAARHRGVEGVP
ncbi:PadR family transcriptional regulator [Streptomyces sp. NPDC058642]|uniref:PadR family transcriptional regulator n=1 Tax=Streptomyces sp. NPDC058642 TaxID=3346572 RepID=UPI003649C754